ncbi:D-alanyl-D-alanine carboxypeptidase family protein [Cephaloticoccus primus]|nr:D-alanyl-D-alanine carboxypeptidase family protein [Cephaloticoccus primus]
MRHTWALGLLLLCGLFALASIAPVHAAERAKKIAPTPKAAATKARAPKSASPAASVPAPPPYKSAIVIDAQTGAVLFEDQADRIAPPASMTKLMSFLVVHDALASGRLRLDSPVRVTAASARVGGTQVWLREGEVFPVEEMLYALMLHSANDCAHALALAASGSVEAFVQQMNARAAELGLTLTRFHNPHGLPPSPPAQRDIAAGNLSTARNIATLCRYLVGHTSILDYSSTQRRSFRPGDPKRRVDMRNHNHLLGKVHGVDGLKTGYTRSAGFCLAATAERDGQRVIAVIMGAPSSKARDLKMIKLLDQGFAALRNGAATRAAVGETPHDAEGQIRFTIPSYTAPPTKR